MADAAAGSGEEQRAARLVVCVVAMGRLSMIEC